MIITGLWMLALALAGIGIFQEIRARQLRERISRNVSARSLVQNLRASVGSAIQQVRASGRGIFKGHRRTAGDGRLPSGADAFRLDGVEAPTHLGGFVLGCVPSGSLCLQNPLGLDSNEYRHFCEHLQHRWISWSNFLASQSGKS
jgi:hypothetical protein